MSFFSIKDPFERDRIVQDYRKTLNDIRKRSEEQHEFGQVRRRVLEETFHPIVRSQAKMTEQIIKSLREKRDSDSSEEELPKKRREEDFGPLAEEYWNRYAMRDPTIDTSFGINVENGQPVIGNTPIKIKNDDIIIYNNIYPGTEGLWELLTEKKVNLQDFDQNDIQEYMGILGDTNVLYKDYNPNSSYPRSNTSWKWKNILGPIWKKLKETDETEIK